MIPNILHSINMENHELFKCSRFLNNLFITVKKRGGGSSLNLQWMEGDHKPINKTIITGISCLTWVSLSPRIFSFFYSKPFLLSVGNVF